MDNKQKDSDNANNLSQILSDSRSAEDTGSEGKISNIGVEIEKQRLELIIGLIQKRKGIRDTVIEKLESMILYCDNRILDLGSDYDIARDSELKKQADKWRQTILELEKMKLGENKELFKDTLMLRNEWIKSLLSYTEEKRLDSLLGQILPKDELLDEKLNDSGIDSYGVAHGNRRNLQ